ncbi:PaaI family thioesterase [Sneathiella sp. CAU 1612]|jgi:acyl-coenzyme A thioesterase PaaI-like protein|uniref:PaaI family thioesterase n=1 Tax=Sneathiella sedimenti TaxID=2816034 RepID=A0ABS3F2Z4_9PROT|nr:PaaI family thioesterase [Sneathiella sedimenti]MBO0332292.1 PaaI family thioesterase [Sneathiella sedimenti]
MTSSSIPEGFLPFASRGRFTEKIGPLYYKPDGDSIIYGFLAEEGHTNGNGVIHGGMLISFLDEALGQIIWRALDKQRCATISLNCNFVASAKPGDWIETRAEISRKGMAVVFVRGELQVRGERILAADGIWKIIGK